MNNIFLVPKKNSESKYRLILNLQKFNFFISKIKFKMETLNSMLDLVQKDFWLSSLDLSDAYFVIPILRSHSSYLKFTWKLVVYKFVIMAFGYSAAPRCYTKLMRVVLSWLRRLGHFVRMYLDDSLQMSKTYQGCLRSTHAVHNMLISCGILPNYRKSQLQLTQVLTILDFVVDYVSMTIALPCDKIEKMLTLVNNALIHPRMLVRELARLIAKMISCFPALPFGRLYYRPLEHVKIEALFRNKYDYNSYITIDGACCQCLEWWTLNLPHAVTPIRLFNLTQIIWTDASSYAWGAFHNNTIAHGYFSPLEMPLSINTKETLAILYGLHSFGSSLSSSHTLIRSDSTCAISYVSKMGGMQSELRDKIACDI